MRLAHAWRVAVRVLVPVMIAIRLCAAQDSVRSPADSVLRRAQQLGANGNAAGGRALADSVLRVSAAGSPAYVDALYARAILSESPDDTRRDLLRIVIEFSLSHRAEDALLRLAQLEYTHGDRTAARKHLEQLALEHEAGTSRTYGLYWMGRVLLDEGESAQGCASLMEAKQRVDSLDVELANQIAYHARPCQMVQRALDSARADSMTRVDSLQKAKSASPGDATARRERTPVKADGLKGAKRTVVETAWSVQVAAYSSREDAVQLAKRLNNSGYEARVTTSKPFRVRIGRFARREDAVQVASKLRVAHTAADVVRAEQP